jgi:hypothetical protein
MFTWRRWPILALAGQGRYLGKRDESGEFGLETVEGMTQLLEQAMGEVRKLPDAGQDAIAAIILEEIADDRRWDDAFARSQDQLGRLANRVRELITIDGSRFNDDGYIESRIANVPLADRGSLRTALDYLYNDDGPVNLPRDRLHVAEPHLEAAELIVIR